jgi:hypothetical protein
MEHTRLSSSRPLNLPEFGMFTGILIIPHRVHKAIPEQGTTKFYDACMPGAESRNLTTKISSLISLKTIS